MCQSRKLEMIKGTGLNHRHVYGLNESRYLIISCVCVYICMYVHHTVHSLAWCGGLSISMTLRAMPAGVQTPGRATQAGQVEG